MRRGTIVTLAVLLSLAVGGGLVAMARHDGGTGQVYSVAQVTAGLAQHPLAWNGRTVEVRGRAVIPLCLGTKPCRPALAILADMHQPGHWIRLTWKQVNPLLALLLRIPYAGAVAQGRVGGPGVYRVLIVRSTLVVASGNLPHYYPYTSKTTVAYDDQALLVDGLN